MRFWKSRSQKRIEREERDLDRLRELARELAREHGFYGDYLGAVVTVAVRGIVPANPDDERVT